MAAENNSEQCSGNRGCEIWKDIKGYEGMYQISNWGRVRSLDRVSYQKHYSGCLSRYEHKGRILRLSSRPNGYVRVTINRHCETVHRLVAEAFLEKPEGKDYINHLDANPKNNHVNNLEWCTQSENIQYAYNNGTKKPPHMKKVSQYDLNGNLIKVWISQTEAARQLGIHQANIYKVCSGKRKTAGGFKWQYTE